MDKAFVEKLLSWGWWLLPIEKHSKEAAWVWISKQMPEGWLWERERVPDEVIRKWVEEQPEGNLAVVCGSASRIFVMDVDAPITDLGIHLSHAEVLTQDNGVHWYFRWPTGASFGICGNVKMQVDWLGNGCYALLPGSNLGRFGGTYVDAGLSPDLPDVPPAILQEIQACWARQEASASVVNDGFDEDEDPFGYGDEYEEQEFDEWVDTGLSLSAYEEGAMKTALYPRHFTATGLNYVALGLAGEAGEFANKIKKIHRDNGGVLDDATRAALRDELGDVLWYVAAGAYELDSSLEEIASLNIEKLERRAQRETLHGDGDNR